MLEIKEIPSRTMLESLLRKQLEKSEQLKNTMSLYWQDVNQRNEPTSHENLMCILRTHIDKKRLDKNKASLGRGRSATPAKVPGGKGTCHQWDEKGACSRGDKCRLG